MFSSVSESRVVSSSSMLKRLADTKIAEMTFIYLCAMRIGLEHDLDWSKRYLERTTRWNEYEKWRSDGNDLYVLLFALKNHDGDTVFPLQTKAVHAWMMKAKHGQQTEPLTRRLFVRLDSDLLIKDSSLRAMRRLVMDWPTLSRSNKRLAMTRLLQVVRTKMSKSEIRPRLEKIADSLDLEIKGATNPDEAPGMANFIRSLSVRENATAGASSASNVAAVVGGLGAGFDPDGHERSVYPAPKTDSKKSTKPIMLRRQK
jgi:hypothetical protein